MTNEKTLGMFPPVDAMIWDIAMVSQRVLPIDLAFIRELSMGIRSSEKTHNKAHLCGLWLEYVHWYHLTIRQTDREPMREAA
jgi:hypothetical protein